MCCVCCVLADQRSLEYVHVLRIRIIAVIDVHAIVLTYQIERLMCAHVLVAARADAYTDSECTTINCDVDVMLIVGELPLHLVLAVDVVVDECNCFLNHGHVAVSLSLA